MIGILYWASDFDLLFVALPVLALSFLGIFLVRPKLAAGISIVVVLFSQSLEQLSGMPLIGWADEALVLAALVIFPVYRLLSRKSLRWIPGGCWFIAYMVMGLLSSLVSNVPLVLSIQGGFLLLKGVLFAFALAQLDWNTSDLRKIARIGGLLLAFILLATVINLLYPGPWTEMLGRMRGGVQYRLGLPSLIGPFVHPVALGQVLALGCSAVLAYRFAVSKGPWSMLLLCASLVGGLLSLRRKVLLALGASLLSVRLSFAGKRMSTGLVAVIVTPLVVIVSFDAIASIIAFTYDEYVVNGDVQARTIFYRDSVEIAVRDFPLGAGFSRFGSYLASTNYSPEYVERGYQWIWGLGPGVTGGFLVDTFWPAIIGESGFFGLAAYSMGLISIFRLATSVASGNGDPHAKWMGIVLVAWSIEFVIESVAAPVYNSPPTFILFFGLVGIVAAIRGQSTTLPIGPKLGSSRKIDVKLG